MGLVELTRNAVHVLPAGGLEEKLKLDRPLRAKLGIDVKTVLETEYAIKLL